MQARNKVIFTFIFLVALLTSLYFFTDWFSKTTGFALGEDEKVKLAQCLSEKGNTLHITSTCSECKEQIELFGSASKFLKIEMCENHFNCPDIKGFPSWDLPEGPYYGSQTLQDLIELSGCAIY
jgi:hypothetical protein